MVALFEPVKLTWKGQDYEIPPHRILRAVAKVEEIITLSDLAQAQNDRIPLAKMAMAYGAVLRFAGASVSDDDIYEAMFTEGGNAPVASVQALLFMMLPKKVRDKLEKQASPDGTGAQKEGNSQAATGEAS